MKKKIGSEISGSYVTALLIPYLEEQRHQIAGNELIMKQSGLYCTPVTGKNDLMACEIGS